MSILGSPRRLLRRVPISARVTAVFAVLFLLALMVVAGLAYWRIGITLRAGIDRSLTDAAAAVQASLHSRDTVDVLDDGQQVANMRSMDVKVQLLARDGRVLDSSDHDGGDRPLVAPTELKQVISGRVLFTQIEGDEHESLRVLAIPVDTPPTAAFLVATELEPVREAQAALLGLLGPLGLLAAALAGLAGWISACRALAPVAQMTAEANRITARDLSQRLSLPPAEDELARLARTLNGMLSRVHAAVQREREFTADASHELRTPLAILRAEIELARDHQDDAKLVAGLNSALEECDRLTTLIDDLLLLARAEATPGLSTWSYRPVDLGDLADTALHRFHRLAATRDITLLRHGEAVVHADSQGLERALSNLIDNALRHTPSHGTVTIEVHSSPSDVTVSVSDTGPGVPPELQDRLFDRFTRGGQARSTPGAAGLGLAIVASVAAGHRGTVEAGRASSGGLRITIRLPAEAPTTETIAGPRDMGG